MRAPVGLLLAVLVAGCYATPARHRGAVWTATVERASGGSLTYRIIETGGGYTGEVVLAGAAHRLQDAHHERGVFTGWTLVDGRRLEVRLEHTGDGEDGTGVFVDAYDRVQLRRLRFRRE